VAAAHRRLHVRPGLAEEEGHPEQQVGHLVEDAHGQLGVRRLVGLQEGLGAPRHQVEEDAEALLVRAAEERVQHL